jgi:hypothetical protein
MSVDMACAFAFVAGAGVRCATPGGDHHGPPASCPSSGTRTEGHWIPAFAGTTPISARAHRGDDAHARDRYFTQPFSR